MQQLQKLNLLECTLEQRQWLQHSGTVKRTIWWSLKLTLQDCTEVNPLEGTSSQKRDVYCSKDWHYNDKCDCVIQMPTFTSLIHITSPSTFTHGLHKLSWHMCTRKCASIHILYKHPEPKVVKESDKGLTIPAVPPVRQPLAWGCTWGSAARRVCPSETSAPHSWPHGPAHTWWWAVRPQCCPQGWIIIVHRFHASLQFSQPLDHNRTQVSCKFTVFSTFGS